MVTETEKIINDMLEIFARADHAMMVMVQSDSRTHRMMIRQIFLDDMNKLFQEGGNNS